MNDILPDQAPLWEFFEDTVRGWLRAVRLSQHPHADPGEDRAVRALDRRGHRHRRKGDVYLRRPVNGESLTLRPEGTASCVRAAIEHNLLYHGPAAAVLYRPDVPPRAPAEGALPAVPSGRRRSARLRRPGRGCRAHGDGRAPVAAAGLDRHSARNQYAGQLRVARALSHPADRVSAAVTRRTRRGCAGGACIPIRCACSTARIPQMQQLIAAAPRLADDLDEESAEAFRAAAGAAAQCRGRIRRSIPGWCAASTITMTSSTNGPPPGWARRATVCAGGRYDGLIAQIGGKPAPACGFAMGVERLLALVADARQAQRRTGAGRVPRAQRRAGSRLCLEGRGNIARTGHFSRICIAAAAVSSRR